MSAKQIHYSRNARSRILHGVNLLADGPVRTLDDKVGDRVLFGKYSGTEVKLDGEEHLIVREDDILGILEK